MQETVVGYPELAVIFRRSRACVPHYIKSLMAKRHFPPPLPDAKRRLWSAARVKEWIDAPDDQARQRVAVAAREAIETGALPDAVVIEARRRLERNYRRGA